MKYLLFVVIIVQCRIASGADCFVHPFRTFGTQTVNLVPLFQWWTTPLTTVASNPHSHSLGQIPIKMISDIPYTYGGKIDIWKGRPYPAWKLIVGHVVGNRPYAFILDAKIYTNPSTIKNERIFLYHAPVQELEQYKQLKKELAELTDNTQHVGTVASMAYDDQQRLQNNGDFLSSTAQNSTPFMANQLNGAINANYNGAASASDREQRLDKSLANMNSRMDEIRATLSQLQISGDDTVMCFALDTGKQVLKMPLFDCGQSN